MASAVGTGRADIPEEEAACAAQMAGGRWDWAPQGF